MCAKSIGRLEPLIFGAFNMMMSMHSISSARRVFFFDSMCGTYGGEFFANILRYLKDEHLEKKDSPLPDPDLWFFDEYETVSVSLSV